MPALGTGSFPESFVHLACYSACPEQRLMLGLYIRAALLDGTSKQKARRLRVIRSLERLE